MEGRDQERIRRVGEKNQQSKEWKNRIREVEERNQKKIEELEEDQRIER